MLNTIAKMLNSQENFDVDDTFHLSFVYVLASPRGREKPLYYIPGHLPVKNSS